MSVEPPAWKAEIYALVRKLDVPSTGEKAPLATDLHIIIQEMGDRQQRLLSLLPTSEAKAHLRGSGLFHSTR
jgi:hypothetical protein